MHIKVITICGSMRYSKEMMKISEEVMLFMLLTSMDILEIVQEMKLSMLKIMEKK